MNLHKLKRDLTNVSALRQQVIAKQEQVTHTFNGITHTLLLLFEDMTFEEQKTIYNFVHNGVNAKASLAYGVLRHNYGMTFAQAKVVMQMYKDYRYQLHVKDMPL